MLSGLRVQINGAGIAGLALAAVLAARGARVRVLERSPEIAEVGAGLQISPNGAAVIAGLGLTSDLVGQGLRSRAVELREHRCGRTVLRLDLERFHTGPHPFVLIHRARLIAMLQAAAQRAGVEICLGDEGGTQASGADLLVGAEGLRSALRDDLNGAAAPFFTGQVAWRAVIRDPAALPEAHVYMGPGRHLVSYALAGGLRNIVAVEERDIWAKESWRQTDDPAHLRAAFESFPPEVRGWLEAVESVHLWGLFRHPVAGRWHDAARVLIGDAAHPTLPFLAQGANLALEDAWVLADSLSQHPLPEALAIYQSRREARVRRAIEAANANARNYHLSNPAIRATAHAALRLGSRIAPGAALRRFDWLYGHDVTAGRS